MLFFFFNDTATTEIYTLSLHDALPISIAGAAILGRVGAGLDLELLHSLHADNAHLRIVTALALRFAAVHQKAGVGDRKSTRLNSSHSQISYAVFCLKKKNSCYPSASQ